MNISPLRTGVALGAVLGVAHLLWSVAVAFGVAQAIVDFIFWMHFIQLQIGIAAFNPGVAAVLVLVTGLTGFGAGYSFAVIWKWLHREHLADSRIAAGHRPAGW